MYSVSLPVWAEWSQRSNNSTNGQIKQIKTSPAASADLNRICRIILPSGNSRHRNYSSEAWRSSMGGERYLRQDDAALFRGGFRCRGVLRAEKFEERAGARPPVGS